MIFFFEDVRREELVVLLRGISRPGLINVAVLASQELCDELGPGFPNLDLLTLDRLERLADRHFRAEI